jgi:drug/metabolite transporter (DMT)-like permease
MAPLDLRVILYLILAALLWAGNAVVGRLLVGEISPLLLSTIRCIVAALVLLPLGYSVLHADSALWKNKKRFLFLGLLGLGGYNMLLYLAIQTSTPINVTLIGASMPIMMLLIGAVFFSTKPNWFQVIGALISISGVCMVLSRGEWQAIFQMELVYGDLLMVLATILWSFYSWMLAHPGKSTERQWPWSGFLLAQVLVGLLWSSAFTVVEWQGGYMHFEPSVVVTLLILYVALGPSLIAYRCWGLGVSRAGPTIAAFFANLIPLFTAILSTVILGESPQGFHGLAFILIATGIAISVIFAPKVLKKI